MIFPRRVAVRHAIPRLEEDAAKPMSAAEALERHFAEHYEPLFRFLRTCGAPEPVAEDLSQEAFLRLYQHLKEDRPGHNLRAWLFRVAYRLWVDRCRLGQRETGVQESVWEVWNQALRDPAPNVERELLARERREWLSAAMLRLSEVERQALHLRSDGLKYGEIAEVLGIGYWRVVEAVRRALDVLGEEAHGR